MRIVIFGAGGFYREKREELLSYTDAVRVACIDNNRQLHGTDIDGIPILPVERIAELDYDRIIIMSIWVGEMKKQLLDAGVDAGTIWTWQRFRSEQLRGSFQFYAGKWKSHIKKKKILLITTDLNYNGGTLAAVYAGKELQDRGYGVTLASPGGNEDFIRETGEEGLDIMICRALPYLFEEELSFVGQFDLVIVNVFQMICAANEISRIKPVIWWIHEPSGLYQASLESFEEYTAEDWMDGVNIYAVSRIAQRNFNCHFPDRIKDVLSYGIPEKKEHLLQHKDKTEIVFAVIGAVTETKGQDIFLEAVHKLDDSQKSCVEFWLIGNIRENPFCNQLEQEIEKEPSVKLLGEMTRKEIQNAYGQIDVLVCPSREDSLPIVVAEAMMYGKPCIVSDSVGTVDYISHGENGLICETGDAQDLAEKINWAFQNRDKLQQIGANGRLVYEKYFTMECFGDRLEAAIDRLRESGEAL